MTVRSLPALLILLSTPLLAQTPASTPAPQTHSSEIGFTYSLPADWEVAEATPSTQAAQQQAAGSASTEDAKKGMACAQMVLTAHHGAPPSVVAVVALPFDCFGQQMTEKDLPSVAAGASEGLSKNFDISGPTYGAYSLGSHNIWIERATGSVIGHPEIKRTVETACTILKKGAVCWLTLAADDDALQTFEHSSVTLDGDTPTALVPATAFDKKPSSGF
ncbi:MAG: hypothetical protein WBQ94_06760 [Terracidiphilus sp.]